MSHHHHHQAVAGAVQYRAAILIVSTKGSQGLREDLTGPKLQELLKNAGFALAATLILPDNEAQLIAQLVKWIDSDQIDLVVTSGGTGLSPTDLTPEATKAVLDREIPGLGEVMRAVSLKKTPMAALSRATGGQRRQSLIINLPGSPKGAEENWEAIAPAITHALDKIKGDPTDCAGIGQPHHGHH